MSRVISCNLKDTLLLSNTAGVEQHLTRPPIDVSRVRQALKKMRSAEDAEAIVLHRVQNAGQMEPRGQYVVLP